VIRRRSIDGSMALGDACGSMISRAAAKSKMEDGRYSRIFIIIYLIKSMGFPDILLSASCRTLFWTQVFESDNVLIGPIWP